MSVAVEPQWRQALEEANRVRIGVARLKGEIASQERPEAFSRAAKVIANPQGIEGHAPLDRLLLSIPRMGRKKVRRMLEDLGIEGGRQRVEVRHLYQREQTSLCQALQTRAQAAKRPNASRKHRELRVGTTSSSPP